METLDFRCLSPNAESHLLIKTNSDTRFMGLEQRTAVAVEKQPNLRIERCTPKCVGTAITNSRTLQRGGVLKNLSGSSGKVYQTKLTPFNEGKTLKELSIRAASTFSGFCENCEMSMFAASENAGVFEQRFQNRRF